MRCACFVALAACASAACAYVPPRPPPSPLIGRFVEEKGDPCPIDIEIVELHGSIGIAEANHLNDDSASHLCSFARVPLVADNVGLRFGDAMACRYLLERDSLWVACEDHGTPPDDLDGAIELKRKPVLESRGVAGLVGDWRAPTFFGAGLGQLKITIDGKVESNGAVGRIEDVGTSGDVFHLVVGHIDELCRYRNVYDKLTIACAPKAAPRSIDAGPRTLVFGRVSSVERSPLENWTDRAP